MTRSKLLAPLIGIVVVVVLAVAAAVLLTRPSEVRVYAAFSVVAPLDASPSGLVARAIVPAGKDCPEIEGTSTDGTRRIAMTPRRPGPIAAQAYSHYLACSAPLPVGLTAASVAGRTIPAAMPSSVSRIAAIADTGCRLKKGDPVQDCNSSDGWPFADMVERIAESRPDLVLDPGDYFYREMSCPADAMVDCAGSAIPDRDMPFKDTDLGWMQDAIEPMSPLFPIAPIAFLRGNHEACDRGGNGFFLYFEPHADTAQTCEPVRGDSGLKAAPKRNLDPWTFDVNVADGRTLRVAMLDNAYGDDYAPSDWISQQRTAFQSLATAARSSSTVESWVLSHRPLFALQSSTFLTPDFPTGSQWVSTQEAAAARDLLTPYDLILTSHVHLAQVTQIPGQPPEILLGNGGTQLEPPTGYEDPGYGPLTDIKGRPQVPGVNPYPPASYVWTWVDFGYAVLTPNATARSWGIDLVDRDGNPIHVCTLDSRVISCG